MAKKAASPATITLKHLAAAIAEDQELSKKQAEMGLWLVDNCDLEACAATAARLRQWDFQLAVCPIRFAGTSGSPVNPVATF